MSSAKLDTAHMANLDGVWRKFHRAEKHIVDFLVESDAFCSSKPCTIGFKPHSEPEISHTTIFIKELRPIPLYLPLILGDALHNLRSALDHLACQLVLANQHDPTQDTAFPIGDPNREYESAFHNRKVKGMCPDASELIRTIQPRNTSDHTLWNLNCLDVADKHRIVITTQLILESWGLNAFGQGQVRWFDQTGVIPIVPGAEIATTTYVSQKEEDVRLVTEIAFGKSEFLPGEPVAARLNLMANSVRQVVLTFDRFFV